VVCRPRSDANRGKAVASGVNQSGRRCHPSRRSRSRLGQEMPPSRNQGGRPDYVHVVMVGAGDLPSCSRRVAGSSLRRKHAQILRQQADGSAESRKTGLMICVVKSRGSMSEFGDSRTLGLKHCDGKSPRLTVSASTATTARPRPPHIWGFARSLSRSYAWPVRLDT